MSVASQSFQDYEHIIIDDGSTDETRRVLERALLQFDNLYVAYQQRSERVIARNYGMNVVDGEWLWWLDSDDALDPMALQTVAMHIEDNPTVDLFTCGRIEHGLWWVDGREVGIIWSKARDVYVPPVTLPGSNRVHDHFPSGKLGTGQFIFSRAAFERVGPMPAWENHLQIADGVDDWLGYKTGYSAEKKWAGNPWGDDWAYFRALTLYYLVHPIHAYLYIEYRRGG
jgi:glycosyltransferase involved in cell wall biosynthesis